MKRLAVVQCLPRERKVRNVKCSVVWWSLNKSSWSERGLRDPTVYSSRPILLFHSMPVTGAMYRKYVMHCCCVPSCKTSCSAWAPIHLSPLLLGPAITPQSWDFVFLFEFVFGFVFVFVPVLVFLSVCEGESGLGETGDVLQPHYTAIVGLRLSNLKLQDTASRAGLIVNAACFCCIICQHTHSNHNVQYFVAQQCYDLKIL